jgi:hypothetical protein
MTLRRMIFPGILAFSAAIGASSACSAPDPGLVIFSTNPAKIKPDAGVVTITDAGSGEAGPAPPPSVFDGKGPYIEGSGGSTLQSEHMKLFGTMNPFGMDCLSCHLPDATTPFVFAGSVVGADDAAANNVEVLIKNPDNTFLATYSDVNGNFFAAMNTAGGVVVAANAKVGARNATATQDMPDPLTGPTQAGCNQKGTCHGGTEGPIHVP